MANFFSVTAPDGTAAGGNNREDYSIDLQFIRNSADEITDGFRSAIIGGKNNEIDGSYAVIVGGADNYAQGNFSFIGGNNNNTYGQGNAVLGQNNTANGTFNFVVGTDNVTTGDYSATIGFNNSINSSITGMYNTTYSTSTSAASGSTILGGTFGKAYLPYSLVTQPKSGFSYPGFLEGTLQNTELMMFKQYYYTGGSVGPIVLTLDGELPATGNQLAMDGSYKAWNMTIDWVLVFKNANASNNNATVTGQTNVVLRKGNVAISPNSRTGYSVLIDKVADTTPSGVFYAVNNWNLVATFPGTGVTDYDVELSFVQSPNVPIAFDAIIYATAKVNIVETKFLNL
jgi:hypothetical protein